jgi:hypothetical protein
MQYLKMSLHKQAVLRLESTKISPEVENPGTKNIDENVAENHREDRVLCFGRPNWDFPHPDDGTDNVVI